VPANKPVPLHQIDQVGYQNYLAQQIVKKG